MHRGSDSYDVVIENKTKLVCIQFKGERYDACLSCIILSPLATCITICSCSIVHVHMQAQESTTLG